MCCIKNLLEHLHEFFSLTFIYHVFPGLSPAGLRLVQIDKVEIFRVLRRVGDAAESLRPLPVVLLLVVRLDRGDAPLGPGERGEDLRVGLAQVEHGQLVTGLAAQDGRARLVSLAGKGKGIIAGKKWQTAIINLLKTTKYFFSGTSSSNNFEKKLRSF